MRQLIMDFYSTPNRWYHTYEHAIAVAHDAQFFAKTLELNEASQQQCYVAGIWHDAVYVWGNKDNEEKSAQALLSIHPNQEVAAELIRHTTLEDHLSDTATVDTDPKLACLLDADLRSMSLDYTVFCIHQLNIAKEAGNTCVTKDHARFLLQFFRKNMGK